MAEIYTNGHEVAYYDCDLYGKMSLKALLANAVKTSEDQSVQLKRANDYVHNLGLTWIITNYQVVAKRLPRVGEQIQIHTQAKEYNKYFCYRDFWVTTEEGEEIVRIETTFALMNQETRKINRVPDELIAPYQSKKGTKIRRAPKMEAVEVTDEAPYRVRYFDLDTNHHVNNAVYIEWMMDVLGYDFLSSHEMKQFQIRFEKEVAYGCEVMSQYAKIEGAKGIQTKHRIQNGDQTYCEAQILWEEIPKLD